jgi:DNA topoisomerase-1
MKLLEGRYGPYVTDGTTNASLPKGADPAGLTPAEAVALLEARAGLPSKKRPARRAGGAVRKAAAGGPKAARARKREPVEV